MKDGKYAINVLDSKLVVVTNIKFHKYPLKGGGGDLLQICVIIFF
jgi:hypothetical protein